MTAVILIIGIIMQCWLLVGMAAAWWLGRGQRRYKRELIQAHERYQDLQRLSRRIDCQRPD